MVVAVIEGDELAECARIANDASARIGLQLRRMFRDSADDLLRAGDALNRAAQLVTGNFNDWLDENIETGRRMAYVYMRFAAFRPQVEAALAADERATVNSIEQLLLGQVHRRGRNATHYDDDMRADARRLFANGMNRKAIAQLLGVSQTAVGRWVDPRLAKSVRADARKRSERQRAARRALKREETTAFVRSVGGDASKVWAALLKQAAVLDRLIGAAGSSGEREALRLALTHIHRADDAIVSALRERTANE